MVDGWRNLELSCPNPSLCPAIVLLHCATDAMPSLSTVFNTLTGATTNCEVNLRGAVKEYLHHMRAILYSNSILILSIKSSNNAMYHELYVWRFIGFRCAPSRIIRRFSLT